MTDDQFSGEIAAPSPVRNSPCASSQQSCHRLGFIAIALTLMFGVFAAVPAIAEPRSIGDCKRIQEADAYNQCLASFGPVAHKRGVVSAPESGDNASHGSKAATHTAATHETTTKTATHAARRGHGTHKARGTHARGRHDHATRPRRHAPGRRGHASGHHAAAGHHGAKHQSAQHPSGKHPSSKHQPSGHKTSKQSPSKHQASGHRAPAAHATRHHAEFKVRQGSHHGGIMAFLERMI